MGGGYSLPVRDVEMLRSALVWVLAGAAVAVVLLFFAAQDVGRLQAQQQTPAQICAALITDATKTSLRSDCAALLAIKDALRGTANLDWGDSGVVFDDSTGEADDWDGITVELSVTILGPPPNFPHLQVARVIRDRFAGTRVERHDS